MRGLLIRPVQRCARDAPIHVVHGPPRRHGSTIWSCSSPSHPSDRSEPFQRLVVMRANTEVHHDLNRWAPICRNHACAVEMLRAIKQSGKPVIQTMTIHAAKGREWDHVFLVGVADGQLPLYLAKGAMMLAEERRLLYVAITRARESLRLYFAPVDHARSQQRFEKRSRFLRTLSVMRTVRVVESQPTR